MQRWGKTITGKQRFFCLLCNKSSVRRRPDLKKKINTRLFVSWITQTVSLERTARRLGISRRGLLKRFKPFWESLPQPKPIFGDISILVIDGVTVVKRQSVALIIFDHLKRIPVFWEFTQRESYYSWQAVFARMRTENIFPEVIVCDGQKGLIKAIFEVWPSAKIQRCVIHVSRQAKIWLTQNPRTDAGKELLEIVKALTKIETLKQKQQWIKSYNLWLKKYDKFLKERTYHPTVLNHWWYTHKKLRATRSLLKNSLENLFIYLDDPRVPRTSNDVEGGINSRIKDLLRIHRGLRPRHQQVLVACYLTTRQSKKPTRKFT